VTVTEHARVVIGADGRHSLVAKAVQPERYNERRVLMSPYYTYWSGVPSDAYGAYIRDRRGFGMFPTNDGLTLIVVGWPNDEYKANRGDIEGNYLKTLELVPHVAEQVRAGQREERFHGTSGEPNFFRKPFGPGWVLVGDAGYLKDPITAQGISDAFRDVELVVDGLGDAFSGRQTFEEAMSHYQKVRDQQAMPIYDFTCQLATMEPPPPEMQHLLGAVSASKHGGDGFASLVAGTMPVPEFFSPENIGQIMATL
jgi:2-polyprenyl-6-methoxyphenol hydroxylase-like FAD-dependent oxidoreductase